jgi:hypothetical protein
VEKRGLVSAELGSDIAEKIGVVKLVEESPQGILGDSADSILSRGLQIRQNLPGTEAGFPNDLPYPHTRGLFMPKDQLPGTWVGIGQPGRIHGFSPFPS